MTQPLPVFRALALAAGVTFASTSMLAAAPLHGSHPPATSTDVVKVQNSTTIIRRDKPHDGAWKRPDHRGEARRGEARRGDVRRDGRREARDEFNRRRNGQGRNNIYKPNATPKYAYDAQGRFTVYDGNRPRRDGRRDDRRDDWRWSNDWRGRDDHGRWDDGGQWVDKGWDDWDDKGWDDGHRRPRYKVESFGFQQPSPALRKVLTAIPKDADAQ